MSTLATPAIIPNVPALLPNNNHLRLNWKASTHAHNTVLLARQHPTVTHVLSLRVFDSPSLALTVIPATVAVSYLLRVRGRTWPTGACTLRPARGKRRGARSGPWGAPWSEASVGGESRWKPARPRRFCFITGCCALSHRPKKLFHFFPVKIRFRSNFFGIFLVVWKVGAPFRQHFVV